MNKPLNTATLAGLCLLSAAALAQEPGDMASALLQQSAQSAAGGFGADLNSNGRAPRIEVQLGAPDARLRLAPCQRTEAYRRSSGCQVAQCRQNSRARRGFWQNGRMFWPAGLEHPMRTHFCGLVSEALIGQPQNSSVTL